MRPAACLLALMASTAAAQDWPQLGNNAERWNHSPRRVEPPYKIRWSLRLTDIHPKHRVYCSAQIIVGGGRAFLGDKSGRLWAFDASSGQVSWTFQAGGEILHSAAYAAGTVFFGAMDAKVYAVDAVTGAPRWTYASGRRFGYSSALLWDGTRVLAVDRGGRLVALAPADGRALWTYDLGAPVQMSPAAAGGRIFLAGEDMKLHAVDAAGGLRAWLSETLPGRGFNDSYPVIVRGKIFLRARSGLEVQLVEGVTSPAPGLSVLDDATGARLPAPEHYHMAGWCGPVAPPAVTADGTLVHATKLLPGNWLVSGFALVDPTTYAVLDRLIGPKVNNYDTGIGAPDEAQVVSVHGDMIFQLNNQGTFWGNPPNEQNGAWDPATRRWHIANAGLPSPPRQGEGDIGNLQQGGSNGVSGTDGRLYHHTWDLVYCWESASTSSNRPPSVQLNAPFAGATFTAPATILLAATASDSDGTVARVDFLANGLLVGSDTTSPFTAAWSGVAAGSYTLTAQARDNAGALAASVPVTISVVGAANLPPAVSLTAPPSAAAPADLLLQATASDPDGTIARVDFLVDGTVVGSDAGPPYTFSWNGVPAGTYAVTARATDDAGASTLSTPLAVTVVGALNQPPLVTLDAPAAGVAPANLFLQATASDPDGAVVRVDFLVDGAVIAGDTAAPWSFAWNGIPAGTYVVAARATDNAGAATLSAPRSVTVTPPPVLRITAPADGASFAAPATFTVTVESSTSPVELFVDGVSLGADALAPYAWTLTNLAPGTYAIRAGTAGIRVTVVAAAPEVVDFSLMDGLLDVPLRLLADGDVLDLAFLPTRVLNIRANLNVAAVEVRFDFDGVPEFRIDDAAPFTLIDGATWTPGLGAHVLAATPAGGGRRVLTFSVVDSLPIPVSAGRDGKNGDHTINDACSATVASPSFALVLFLALALWRSTCSRS